MFKYLYFKNQNEAIFYAIFLATGMYFHREVVTSKAIKEYIYKDRRLYDVENINRFNREKKGVSVHIETYTEYVMKVYEKLNIKINE